MKNEKRVKINCPCDLPDSAFPFELNFGPEEARLFHPGLSKREWFAGMALQGIIMFHGHSHNHFKTAFEYADAMIAEGQKK